jgi:hypothetical protein
MEMMSAAILIAVDTEQSGVRPATADPFTDQSQVEGTSFAKSFNERVGDSTLLQVKNGNDPMAIGLLDSKSGAPGKQSDEVWPSPSGINGKTLAPHETSTLGRLKSNVAEKLLQPQATALGIPQDEDSSGEATTREVKAATPATIEAEDALNDSQKKPVAAPTDGHPVLTIGMQRGGAPPSVSGGSGAAPQKETEIEGKTKSVELSKKTEKLQERLATPKIAQKPVETAVTAITFEAKQAVVSLAEGAGLVRTNAVASDGMPSSEVSKASGGSRIVSSGVPLTFSGIAPSVGDGAERKEVTPSAKVSVTGTETTVIATDDVGSLQKSSTSLERLTANPLAPGGDGDRIGQSGSGPALVVAHSLSGSAEVATGMSAVVFAPAGAHGDSNAMKFALGETIRDTADTPAGSKEPMGFGAVPGSMEGMPRTLTTTSTALEVGIQDGTHGWLKVRAEMADGGVVNASVSATTSVGQEMLHRELPSLTTYLQTEKVAVNTVVVHPPAAAANDLRSSSGMDGAGGQTPQRNDERGEQQRYLGKATADSSNEAMTHQNLREADGDASLPRVTYAGGGSWLNVRA